ncbi:hypothetical protein HUN59_16525 [Curtobacterium sp. Csp2]|uniref:hypothetical protein n=2 Tax=Curtobacterium TaxID=2034 RepID=UPI0015803365|nr:hypothetical protein [Curtobacterium sp. Csp2]QKS17605.1 hypothetical protein HUN59_16525 [Curtobacterium sp. Csp2]
MKSFLRAAAATGVAAATLAAGISFGPAATADPAAVAAEASSGMPVQFASNEPGSYLGTPYYGYVGSFGTGLKASTAGDAIKNAAILRAVPTGQTTANGFPTYFIKAPNGNCVAHEHRADDGGSWDIIKGLSCGTVRENGRWFLEPSKGLRLEDGYTVSTGFTSRGSGGMAAIRGYATKARWALFPETLGVWAKAVSVDIEAGTAQLADGVAPPAASSVEVSYEDKTGKTVRFDEDVIDGTWSASLRNLKLGVTTVHLTAFDGAEVVAEADVEVDLPVTPLTAEATFGDELDEVATISGTATAETEVKLFHGEKQIASTTSLKDGSYSIPVNAPNMAGAFDLTVTQTIRGEDATPKELSIDYGAGVSITSPAQGVELQPGDQLAITGAAQKSSKIRVYEKGKPEAILAETTAGKTTDTYRVVLRDLEDREYQLVVDSLSKGYNHTTAELSVNPGKSVELDPATVTTESFTPGKTNTFEGTATKDATLRVVNRWGTDLLGKDVTVKTDGTWSFDRAVSASSTKFEFRLVQTKGNLSTTSEVFTIAADTANSLVDPTVTAPTAVVLGENNTFTGTATADASLKIVNASGTDLLGHPVTVTGSGDWTFDRVVSRSAKNFTFYIEQTKNGTSKKTGPYVINPADPAASLVDPTVTAPTAVALGVNNTFTGTATEDASLKIVNASGTDLLGHPVTVTGSGDWTFDRVVSWNAKNFTFYIEQTKNGTTKKTGPYVINPVTN